MMSRRSAVLLAVVTSIIVGGAAYAAGLSAGHAAAAAGTPSPSTHAAARTAQAPDLPPPTLVPPSQVIPAPAPAPAPGQPPTMREFVPLPMPGDQMPGQQPGNQQGDCDPIILFYHNGQLYQLRPGPGPRDGQGRPGVPPEFYQLNPYQGPPIPGLPAPRQDRGPGFSPVNPRS